MNGETASSLFKGPEKLNCAQAVFKAFQEMLGMSDAEIEDHSGSGGGKAPDGECGAYYAAKELVDGPSAIDRLTETFQTVAGSIYCRDIRKLKRSKCRECVRIAGNIVASSLRKEI